MDSIDINTQVAGYNNRVRTTAQPAFITEFVHRPDHIIEFTFFAPASPVGWPNGKMTVTLQNEVDLQIFLDMMLRGCGPQETSRPKILASEVQWVVNDSTELGVKIHDQFFFMYRGRSLVYPTGKYETGDPRKWRHIGQLEFGESVTPALHEDPGGITGNMPYNDHREWFDLPPDPHNLELTK